MSYRVILKDGTVIHAPSAMSNSLQFLGYLIIEIPATDPMKAYDQFHDPENLDPIKVVHFAEKAIIVTDADGSRHIETICEQDPKVRVYHGYTRVHALERSLKNPDNWSVTLVSNTPEPETVLEIYEEDKPIAETGGTANDESPTE